jgi:hypothetical protein
MATLITLERFKSHNSTFVTSPLLIVEDLSQLVWTKNLLFKHKQMNLDQWSVIESFLIGISLEKRMTEKQSFVQSLSNSLTPEERATKMSQFYQSQEIKLNQARNNYDHLKCIENVSINLSFLHSQLQAQKYMWIAPYCDAAAGSGFNRNGRLLLNSDIIAHFNESVGWWIFEQVSKNKPQWPNWCFSPQLQIAYAPQDAQFELIVDHLHLNYQECIRKTVLKSYNKPSYLKTPLHKTQTHISAQTWQAVQNILDNGFGEVKLYPYQKEEIMWLFQLEYRVLCGAPAFGILNDTDCIIPGVSKTSESSESIYYYKRKVDLNHSMPEWPNHVKTKFQHHFSPSQYCLSYEPPPKKTREFTAKGGILGTRPGMGKTFTLYSMVALNSLLPPIPIQAPYWCDEEKRCFIQTNATLMVVPNQMCEDTFKEAQKLYPEGSPHAKKIIRLGCERDLKGIKCQDIVDADLVIVSIPFFSQPTTIQLKKKATNKVLRFIKSSKLTADSVNGRIELPCNNTPHEEGQQPERKKRKIQDENEMKSSPSPTTFDLSQCDLVLDWFVFRRKFIDEANELSSSIQASTSKRKKILGLKSKVTHYVSGTPFPTRDALVLMTEILDLHINGVPFTPAFKDTTIGHVGYVYSPNAKTEEIDDDLSSANAMSTPIIQFVSRYLFCRNTRKKTLSAPSIPPCIETLVLFSDDLLSKTLTFLKSTFSHLFDNKFSNQSALKQLEYLAKDCDWGIVNLIQILDYEDLNYVEDSLSELQISLSALYLINRVENASGIRLDSRQWLSDTNCRTCFFHENGVQMVLGSCGCFFPRDHTPGMHIAQSPHCDLDNPHALNIILAPNLDQQGWTLTFITPTQASTLDNINQWSTMCEPVKKFIESNIDQNYKRPISASDHSKLKLKYQNIIDFDLIPSKLNNPGHWLNAYGATIYCLFELISEICSESIENRILLFNSDPNLLKSLAECAKKEKFQFAPFLFCRGGINHKEESLRKFKDITSLNNRVMCLSLINTSSGVNLQCASHVIYLDTSFENSVSSSFKNFMFSKTGSSYIRSQNNLSEIMKSCKQQAIPRTHRIGQQKSVQVLTLLMKFSNQMEHVLSNC